MDEVEVHRGTGIYAKCVELRGLHVSVRASSRGVAQRITEAISHRGPDQQGVFEGSEATLCAVRLKIIDLGGGDQPIVSDDGIRRSPSTAKSTIIGKCAANWKRWVIGSARTATPRRCCGRSWSGTRRVFRGCAGCSRWRCGRNRGSGWCWCATGWGSSRCTTTAAATMSISDRN